MNFQHIVHHTAGFLPSISLMLALKRGRPRSKFKMQLREVLVEAKRLERG